MEMHLRIPKVWRKSDEHAALLLVAQPLCRTAVRALEGNCSRTGRHSAAQN